MTPSRDAIAVRSITGDALGPILADLARLRITVFREFPYLYDGTLAYEERYLADFANAEGATVIAAYDGATMVGAATASSMRAHADDFGEPFARAGIDLGSVFYFGESVLLASHRGLGLGHAFFDGREARALAFGASIAAFCRVVRPDEHPRRPADYAPLDPFWRKRGYAPLEGMVASYAWKDLDEPAETDHPMQFWSRHLR